MKVMGKEHANQLRLSAKSASMATLVYRCLTTGYLVQGFAMASRIVQMSTSQSPASLADDCNNVNPKTGKVLGSGPFSIFRFKEPGRL